ncbi:MAG: hypothetical protein IT195_07270 [Microthrixaceae bacterium]|nr:hypothetical protein [Microthrixaceae bacterium]
MDGDELIDRGPEEERLPWWWPLSTYPGDEEARQIVRKASTFATVTACCLFMFFVVRDGLLLNTTPTGGDMGAHVWGPAYLRDELLPNWRLTGWSPDWYAGFPAYTFYMVVPSLAIVVLNVGLLPWYWFPLTGIAFVALWRYARSKTAGPLLRALITVGCVAGFVLSVEIPYNIAFKLVVVSGLVLLPAGVWYFASGLGLRSPGPELMSVAGVFFLMDKSLFSILGGNVASTMAGEFSFSISFTLSLFFLGVAARGMATGRRRVVAVLLLSGAMLCHVIPFIYLCLAVPILMLLRMPWTRAARAAERYGVVDVPEGEPRRGLLRRAGGWTWAHVPMCVKWFLPVGLISGLLSIFWYGPFMVQSTFLNDMGWEKYGRLIGPDGKHHDYLHEYLRYLYPIAPHTPTLNPTGAESLEPNMLHGRVFFILAGIGVLLSLLLVVRAGIFLALVGGAAALAFWLMPQWRFWNARVLPLYYLCVYLLAALGVWLVIRAVYLLIVGRWAHPPNWIGVPTTVLCSVGSLGVLLVSMHIAPGGKPVLDEKGAVKANERGEQAYGWGPFTTYYHGPVRDWVRWNFDGYENKPSRTDRSDSIELEGIRQTMSEVGRKYGCGRAYWEYEPDLNRFGTPMALMLLPYWTQSCIGSMEGLYFEASATTPFHFAMQGELSSQCSCAQRPDTYGLTYGEVYKGAQPELGFDHMQMLGVKYFMATSDTMKQAAEADKRLRKIASTGPWDVYEMAGSELVVGLDREPAVWSNVEDNFHSWGNPAMSWYLDSDQWDTPMASKGEPSWEKVKFPKRADTKEIEPAEVDDVVATRDTISFSVSEVGKPVLVRSSYFPNWEVSGAKGPYRVTPNLMVVIPTSKDVKLTYGRTSVELATMGMSAIGLVLLMLLARRREPGGLVAHQWLGDREPPPPPPSPPPSVPAPELDAPEASADGSEVAEPADTDDPSGTAEPDDEAVPLS